MLTLDLDGREQFTNDFTSSIYGRCRRCSHGGEVLHMVSNFAQKGVTITELMMTFAESSVFWTPGMQYNPKGGSTPLSLTRRPENKQRVGHPPEDPSYHLDLYCQSYLG